MIIEYEKEYLEELYANGKCKNKKYRFQQSVVTKYQKRIDTLMAATRIEDLFVFNSDKQSGPQSLFIVTQTLGLISNVFQA